MSSAFTTGDPTDLATLTATVQGLSRFAVARDREPYACTECFAVVIADGTAGAPAKLHKLRGQLRAAGFSVRSNLCGSTSSVLVRKSPQNPPHSPPTVRPSSSHGMISGLTAGVESGAPFDPSAHALQVALVMQMARRHRREGVHSPAAITRFVRRMLAKLAATAHTVPLATYEPREASDDGRCLTDGCTAATHFELRDETDERGEGEHYCREHGPEEVKRLIAMGWTYVDLERLPSRKLALMVAA